MLKVTFEVDNSKLFLDADELEHAILNILSAPLELEEDGSIIYEWYENFQIEAI